MTPSTTKPTPTFADFAVHPDIVAALEQAGIVHPFAIQAMTLPVALSGHDIIGQAKTGTGKTLGFGVPILQNVVPAGTPEFDQLRRPGAPQALVVVPTRELAVQVAGDLTSAARLRGVRILAAYGGRAYEPQVAALRAGIEVVVGTPGRLLDLSRQKHLDLSQTATVVLDEADEMLDLGFLPDVENLMALTPASRQTMLFSATMPGAIVTLARRYMIQPTHIRAMGEENENPHMVKAIEQFVYRAHSMDKIELLARVLQAKDRGLCLVFTRTKRSVAKVAEELTDRGFAVAAIHGDLGQGAREQALRAFRNGKIDVLVATDVAARGIDVDDITHVVNYQCPEDEKTYVHRIGRTARAGNTGIAVTLVDWEDMPRWSMIDRQLDLGIPEPVETYSSSEHLHDDLDIPPGLTGRLARTQQTRAGLEAEELEDLGETGRAAGRRRAAGADKGHGGGGRRGTGDRATSGHRSPGRDGSSSAGSESGGGRGTSRRTREAAAGGEAQPSSGPRRQRNRRRTVRGTTAGQGPASAGASASTADERSSGPTVSDRRLTPRPCS